MTEDELVRILQEALETAPAGEKAISVVVFGIRYADELSRLRAYPNDPAALRAMRAQAK